MRRSLVLLAGFQMFLQLLLHGVPFLGRFVDVAGMGRNYNPDNRYMGILCNGFDNYSYAAWAQQVSQGHILMTNLYATEPHRAVLFNPFFCVVGAFTWLLKCPPLILMVVFGFAAIPVLTWAVAATCRALGLSEKASVFAVVLVLFATGPSVVINALAGIWGGKAAALNGIDLDYFDLFPATSVIAAPYQMAASAIAAVVLLLVVRTLGANRARSGRVRVFGCASAIAVLVLIRPYQAAVLAMLFPLSIAATGILARRPFRLWAGETAVSLAVLLPPICYLAWMSTLPVWNLIEKGFLLIEVTRLQITIGFSLFWIGAAIGLTRAIRTRNIGMVLFGLWFVGSVFAMIALGRGATKFADSAVIGYAVLTAYGLSPLIDAPRDCVASGLLAMRTAVLLAVCTTCVAYGDIIHSVTPEPDVDIVSIAQVLRAKAAGPPALVLTSCEQSMVLPAFAFVRTYAGHWALTPDYVPKCRRVEKAGFDQASQENVREADFRSLIAATTPDYIVVRSGYPADRWTGHAPIWSGNRWSLYSR